MKLSMGGRVIAGALLAAFLVAWSGVAPAQDVVVDAKPAPAGFGAGAGTGPMLHLAAFGMGPPGPMLGDGPGMMLPLLLFAGDLTDAQKEQVHQIMKANRETIGGMFSDLRSANDELANKLLVAGDVKQADLQPTLDKIAGIRQRLLDNGIKVALQIRALMTPDQIAKAASVRTKLEQLEEEKRKLLGKDNFMLQN